MDSTNHQWKFQFSKKADKEFSKLDKSVQQRIYAFFDKMKNVPNPRDLGEALTGRLKEYWKYRTSDYRMICKIEDNILTIMVLKVGHRKEIYTEYLQ